MLHPRRVTLNLSLSPAPLGKRNLYIITSAMFLFLSDQETAQESVGALQTSEPLEGPPALTPVSESHHRSRVRVTIMLRLYVDLSNPLRRNRRQCDIGMAL